MIKAEKKEWAEFIFHPYEELLLKRNFSSFNVMENIPELNPGKALIITPNHFSWWDGFFIDFAVRKLLSKNFYLLMLEQQLKRYPFFSKVGAFSINPDRRSSITESLYYCSRLLLNPVNCVVYYPQGAIEPFDKKPMTLMNGLFSLLRENKDIDILPAAFRIEYGNRKKPSVYLKFGSVLPGICVTRESFEAEFLRNLTDLNENVIKGRTGRDLFGGT